MQSQFSDRPFTADDAPYVVAAHTFSHAKPFVSAPPTEQLVIDRLNTPNVMRRIVLNERGERAGLWVASSHEGWLVEIHLIIATVPRSGAGRFALRSAMRWAFEEVGAHRAWLEVTAANVAARALYESEGFVHEGTYRHGFRGQDGGYEDLTHYGFLETEYRR
jgi:RimJ/RimL family protein N-acetyltransferase